MRGVSAVRVRVLLIVCCCKLALASFRAPNTAEETAPLLMLNAAETTSAPATGNPERCGAALMSARPSASAAITKTYVFPGASMPAGMVREVVAVHRSCPVQSRDTVAGSYCRILTQYPYGASPVGAFQLRLTAVVLLVAEVKRLAPFISGFCTGDINGAKGPPGNDATPYQL